MTGVFENNVLCPFCELDILDYVTSEFYRDPVRREFEFYCPRCKACIDIEVVPVPVFQASIPVGRIIRNEKE